MWCCVGNYCTYFWTTDGPTFVEGLVDAGSEAEFDDKLCHLQAKWIICGQSFLRMVSLLMQGLKSTMLRTMIQSVREAAGLSDLPSDFCTNVTLIPWTQHWNNFLDSRNHIGLSSMRRWEHLFSLSRKRSVKLLSAMASISITSTSASLKSLVYCFEWWSKERNTWCSMRALCSSGCTLVHVYANFIAYCLSPLSACCFFLQMVNSVPHHHLLKSASVGEGEDVGDVATSPAISQRQTLLVNFCCLVACWYVQILFPHLPLSFLLPPSSLPPSFCSPDGEVTHLPLVPAEVSQCEKGSVWERTWKKWPN